MEHLLLRWNSSSPSPSRAVKVQQREIGMHLKALFSLDMISMILIFPSFLSLLLACESGSLSHKVESIFRLSVPGVRFHDLECHH